MVRLSRAYKKKMGGRRKSRKQRGGGCGCASPMAGGKRRTKRRRRKKTKRVRRTKRKRRKKRKRRRKQRGGNLLASSNDSNLSCNYPKNLGNHFGNKLNSYPFLPDPQNNNGNMKGGGLWSDVKQYWWKGNDAITNTGQTYKGAKHKVPVDTLVHPGMGDKQYTYRSTNLGEIHNAKATEVKNLL